MHEVSLDRWIDRTMLAVGGQQKVANALSYGGQSVLGPHRGELAAVVNRQRFDPQSTGDAIGS